MKQAAAAPKTVKSNTRSLPRPVIVILAALLVLSLAFNLRWVSETAIRPPADAENIPSGNQLIQIRSGEIELVNPLRLVDVEQESSRLQPVKQEIARLIESKMQKGKVSAISVYYRRLKDGSWFSINDTERYHLGSIAKIALMMHYLRQAQEKPSLLNKSILYDRPVANPKQETFPKGSMVLGRTYTIGDLIRRMIVESDNIATTILLLNMEKQQEYPKIFKELGLREPLPHDPDYRLSASECSRFLRVLYDATLLNEVYSRFALNLLARAEFAEGLRKPLPGNISVANKFGEAGDPRQPEFSETGIVYQGEEAYLMTVMTKGSDSREQAETISEISQVLFHFSEH